MLNEHGQAFPAIEYGLITIAETHGKDKDSGQSTYSLLVRFDSVSGNSFHDIHRVKGDEEKDTEAIQKKILAKLGTATGVKFNLDTYAPNGFEVYVLTAFGKDGWDLCTREQKEKAFGKDMLWVTTEFLMKRVIR
jgi:hypothetical protein